MARRFAAALESRRRFAFLPSAAARKLRPSLLFAPQLWGR